MRIKKLAQAVAFIGIAGPVLAQQAGTDGGPVRMEKVIITGTINLIQIHEAQHRKEPGGGVIVPDITARYTVSPLGVANLRAQIAQIDDTLKRMEQGFP